MKSTSFLPCLFSSFFLHHSSFPRLVVAGVLLAVLYGKPKPPEVIEETETAVV
jgi:hypothetical protein